MKRLIWKEHREYWFLGLTLCIGSILIAAIGSSYTFLGSMGSITPWVFLPIIISMVSGSYSISHAKNDKYFDYCASIAVNLDKLICAKAMLALAYNIVAALLSMAVFLISCRAEYRPFVSCHGLVYGLIKAIGFTSIAWYFGFGLSVFSRFETNLHTLLWTFTTAFLSPFIFNSADIDWWNSWPTWVLVCLLPLLTILYHRHYRWNPRTKSQMTGFAIIALVSIAIAIYAGHYQTELQTIHEEKKADIIINQISPNGTMVIYCNTMRRPWHSAFKYHWYLRDANHNRHSSTVQKLHAKQVYDYPISWFDERTLIGEMEQNGKPVLNIITLSENHQPVSVRVPFSGIKDGHIMSESVNTAIYSSGLHDDTRTIRILDVRNAKWLSKPIQVSYCWWQSADSVGYVDTAGKRQILQLSGGNR